MENGSQKILFISLSVTLFTMAIVYYSFYTGRDIAERYTPLVDATMEIKLEATTAHLWFEELISGDQSVNIEDVWTNLDQSEWYAQAMLNGGTNEDGTFLALKDPHLRLQIEETIDGIHHFRQLAERRWEKKSTSAIGSDIDQQFDLAFLKLNLSADNVEVALQGAISEELQKFKFTQVLLLALILVLGAAISGLWLRYSTRQAQIKLTLQSNEERWAFALEGSGDGVWDLNLQTNQANYSKRWKEMLGYSEDEIIPTNQEWVDRIHPEDTEVVSGTMKAYLEGSIPLYIVTYRLRCKDDSYKWILGRGMIVSRDVYNMPLRMVGTHTDITDFKRIEQKLIESESFAKETIDASSSDICVLDKEGKILAVNQAWRNFYDKNTLSSNKHDYFVGANYYQICKVATGDDSNEASSLIEGALQVARCERDDFSIEYPCHSPTEQRWFNARVTRFKNDSGNIMITHENITTRKLTEEKLKLAASVFSHAREGIIITDDTATIIDVNHAFTRITGFSREEVIGKNPRILQSARQSPEFYVDMWQALLKEGYWFGEVWNRRKNGEVYAVLKTISAVRDEQGITTHYVALGNDITPMKDHQNQLEHIAHFDILTNLPNRSLLADRLSQAMVQCRRQGHSLAVVFLDLDGFKAVNDAYGHDVGDELLIALSLRMKEALREGDTLSRIGGDEFVAVLTDLTHLNTVEDCEPVLARLLLAASEPVTIGDIVLNISASIGVTLYPKDNVDADQLMRHADQAMYVAKESGKNRYHLFDTAQDDAVKVQRESLEAIRSALDNHQFVLHYQPKVNMKTGLVAGFEALIRWQHPTRGLLNPIDFLPVIENNAMSIDMGEWVIDSALTQISQWKATGLNLPLNISVNIAAVQLQQPDFTQRLTMLLAAHPDVEPRYLELEVLETSALDDVQHVSTIMNACMVLGVNFALDDFGTGYSSLTYLRRLPANLIKIDQTFVRDMLIDADDLAIVEGVIALAKSFKRDVIAEGVETIEHGTALLQLGCELAQGYGIARPMPASDIPTWISDWKPDVSWQV